MTATPSEQSPFDLTAIIDRRRPASGSAWLSRLRGRASATPRAPTFLSRAPQPAVIEGEQRVKRTRDASAYQDPRRMFGSTAQRALHPSEDLTRALRAHPGVSATSLGDCYSSRRARPHSSADRAAAFPSDWLPKMGRTSLSRRTRPSFSVRCRRSVPPSGRWHVLHVRLIATAAAVRLFDRQGICPRTPTRPASRSGEAPPLAPRSDLGGTTNAMLLRARHLGR